MLSLAKPPASFDPPRPETPVRVALAGDVRWTTIEGWSAVADELVAKYPNAGVPDVQNCASGRVYGDRKLDPSTVTANLALVSPPSSVEIKAGAHDVLGEARSLTDLQAAEAAGFAPKAPIYRRGTRVNETGVANATRSRAEHDAMPSVGEACADFMTQIRNERRTDDVVPLASIRMTKDGLVTTPNARYHVTERAFETLVGYHSGIGGAGYLTKCWPALRAHNVNEWMGALANDEIATRNQLKGKELATWEPSAVRLRTRNANSASTPREIFGVVSAKRYTTFDVDSIAKALLLAMPENAKARVTYDGRGAIFDIQFHSNVQPKHYVAGEFFKAGFRVKTDDTGGGSIIGSAMILQNLCLNLIILDRATTPIFRLRHVGSVEHLRAKLVEGMKTALDKLRYFLDAWDYAADDNRILPFEEGIKVPAKLSELMPGIFNSVLERELVPVHARRTEAIPQLMKMWEEDTSYAAHDHSSVSRAAVVNAFTRYAHEIEQDDFAGDEIERSVSSLLYGKGSARPAPLTYLPVGRRAEEA